MSRIGEVLKNKNRVERANKARRKDELTKLRTRAAFNARLQEELSIVNLMLSDSDVDCVVIEVPEKYIALFSSAIYSEELADYSIAQHGDEPNQFEIRPKMLSF